ncbi:hypothetical protein BC829DRAFT_419019 [Chytridium lagenaria]|nr:hypothetical protein BC829DRAFT_419019 [Chytridium lagenaria]
MAANVLVQSHVFGLNREVRNNVTYLDEQTILYPAGTQLIQYNVEQKIQKFLSVNEGDGITTLHNPRKRKLLMPAEGIQSKHPSNLLCHCWINDVRIVAGTEDSKILVFDSGDLILEISYVVPMSGTVQTRPPTIQTVTAFAGGIIAGTSTGVTVGCIALSPAEDMAGEEIKCDRLAQPFHNGNIIGMDTCARKPLVATCGSDKSIRIWNYVENSIEVIKYFDDEPFSISLHPSGLYVLVGFADSLKLMNILIDDIRPFWESNIRGCRECRFSNGGQYFASVYGSRYAFTAPGPLKPLAT